MADENEEKRKRTKFFGVEGNLIAFMTKLGHIIILNIIWLLCCIPIITIGTSTTSFYYAMIKNVRHDRGYPVSEFFQSFKRTFTKGTLITVAAEIWLMCLYYLRTVAISLNTETGVILDRTYITVMVLTAVLLLYIFPVLSRFTMKISSMVKLAFVMSVRYIGFSILFLLVPAIMIWLYIFYLPIPTILFIPGIWCYLCTYMMEIVLRKYMPAPDGNEDAWYYE